MIGRYLLYIVSAICFGLLIFNNLGVHQLEFFDEARRGVNALEMYNGQSNILVPTYAGVPDHWGTKPPLLIWMQVVSFHVFGVGEVGLRFPAALATSLAILLLIWFSWRQWKTPVIGILASWVMLMNWDFIGNHGARSGDYDALLLLFCLGQLTFFARLVATQQYRYLYLSALCVLLAGWTKGIAGCFLMPAIALYVVLVPEGRRYLFEWRMYVSYALALLGILSYYFMREQFDPGYLQLVYDNELGGRFMDTTENHKQPFYHYVERLVKNKTFGLFALLLVPAFSLLLLIYKRYKGSLLFGFGGLVFLLVISSSATKLFWYLTPALPLIGMVVAISFHRLWEWISNQEKINEIQGLALGSALFLSLFAWPTSQLLDKVSRPGDFVGMKSTLSAYREVMESDSLKTPYTVMPRHYHAPARFYAAKEKLKGKEITFQPVGRIIPPLRSQPSEYAKLAIGERVLICESKPWDWMTRNHGYRVIDRQSYCTLVEILWHDECISERHLPD